MSKKPALTSRPTVTQTLACLLLSGLFVLFAFQLPEVSPIIQVITGIGLFIAAFICINRVFSSLLSTRAYSATPESMPVIPHRRRFWLYSLPCAAVWLLYLIAFYPGLMTYDSIMQWGQIISGSFGDWHPVMHTWFMLSVTRLWFSPAMVALSQIIILSAIFGYGMISLEKAGVRRRFLVFATVLFAISPVNGMMVVTLWKDVLFSAAMLLFTLIAMNITATKGKWLDSVPHLILLTLSSLGMIFFRHNGIYCFIPAAVLFLIFFRRRIFRLSVLFTGILLLYFIIIGPVYDYMNVNPAFEGESYSVPLNIMGAVVSYGDNFTDAQLEQINALMPVSKWKSTYDPFIADPLKRAVNYDVLLGDKAGFLKLLAKISLQNPEESIAGAAKLTSLVWRIPEYKDAYTATPPTAISSNQLDLETQSLWPGLTTVLTGIYGFSTACLQPLLWRPALSFFLILLFGTLILFRQGRKGLVVCAAALCNNLTVFIAIPAQDFRYLYANTLIVLPVMLFALVGKKPVEANGDNPPE